VENLALAFDAHKLPGACGGSEMCVVTISDAQDGLPRHCNIYDTLDAELAEPYVLLLLATKLSRSGSILKTFTFKPYRYRYASLPPVLPDMTLYAAPSPYLYSNTVRTLDSHPRGRV